ncbi:uncharacterized protein BXIN_2634 [Babesia sp. Xinjiang]|uniref:uncharacterized protein n=1 Tax=Babesia sp. Xinjiang TaxID=462227 RepID=UPI000A24BC3C|nr:uncharacterized protein BXIN_2686 [Babesia sp. Xinjiang]XP_028872113.1 uncharacterized protein BXIN_2634 [Babesia sp. Xinjiang]ORM41618.1 hypothetical protein BXIN_2686 [Babesia sp. Xinjiang]ORM41657.1 hypothetical protein BXIN_2634 [Babesia sp. Xinjiang]
MVKTYVDSLRQTRQRLSALLSEAGDGDDPNGFVATYRTLVSELDDIVTFLEPCDHESEPRFIKAYESALEDTGDPNFDADIAEAIADLQREACEAITFLEGVGHIARNTDIFLKGQRENQNALLVSHNSLRDNLLQHKVEAEAALIDNASILDMLNHDIAISEDRIKRLNESHCLLIMVTSSHRIDRTLLRV